MSDVYEIPSRINKFTGAPEHQTIFPKFNYQKSWEGRYQQRGLNGRVFLDHTRGLDDTAHYPAEPGSLSFSDALPFPVDLGPDATVNPTTVYDLRQDDGLESTYDLGTL